MALERTLRDPIQLLDPASYLEPVPTPDCDVCGALARQLKEARTSGPNYDLTRASDIIVEMRRHQDATEESAK
jgi:hypothetical protein